MNFQKGKGIGWCDATWNPITGCLGPRGDGVWCSYCYANKLANGRLKALYLSNPFVMAGDDTDPFAPRSWIRRLQEPLHLKKPSKIFVCDMGELFGNWVFEDAQGFIFNTIKKCPKHIFQLLTKQPQNLIKFSPFPDNCFVGVSATTNSDFLRAIDYLPYVKASIKFISFEPLLAPIPDANLTGIDWIIIGGKSGKDPFYPPPTWRQAIENEADKLGIPIFEKDNLFPHPQDRHLRREFPSLGVRTPNLDPPAEDDSQGKE